MTCSGSSANVRKKTAERYRLKHNVAPTGKTAQKIALFPAPRETHFGNAIAIATFQNRFKKWLEDIELPGHVSHRARHTLARGSSMPGAPMVVGSRFSARIRTNVGALHAHLVSQDRTLLTASVGERSRQQCTGRTRPDPDLSANSAIQPNLIDIAALPTEGGLCTLQTRCRRC